MDLAFSVVDRLQALAQTLQEFCANEFLLSEKYFCVIYGSYAYGTASQHSDADIMIVASETDESRQARCISFVKRLHESYGMCLDYEVQYEDKLLVPLSFLEHACSGAGFRRKDGSWHVSTVVKSREYLRSSHFLLRFLHGVMAHKHVFIAGDPKLYSELRAQALENLVRATLTTQQSVAVNFDQMIDFFLSNNGATGDYYLGFENKPEHTDYLKELCSEVLGALESKSLIYRINTVAYDFAHFLGEVRK